VAERLGHLSERHESVLLDLDELTFIDAKGARLVVEAAEASRRDGFAFAITPGSRPVQRLFELLEIAGTLPYDGEMTP
jgi:anti-anti-sigma factor